MASKATGIALLSTYNDKDDDMEDLNEEEEEEIEDEDKVVKKDSNEELKNDDNENLGESEVVEVEGGVRIAVEVSKDDIDPLDKFLPSPPKEKCSDELQDRINKFLALKRAGKSFNAEVRNKKDYRNPDFLHHAVRYQDIDQIGSCFSKHVFDPHGYDKSDYYDEIEVDMKREMESQKFDLLSGGSVIRAPKIGMPIQGVPTGGAGAGGLHSIPIAPDAVARDGRQNKKSKWDKVDGDRGNLLPSGRPALGRSHKSGGIGPQPRTNYTLEFRAPFKKISAPPLLPPRFCHL